MNKIKIVFWGDSITANGDWPKLLDRKDVLNAGIPGITSENLIYNINEVVKYKPDTCYLMIGINDIRFDVSMNRLKSNYNRLIDSLVKHNINPVIESTLYTNDDGLNKKVEILNAYIKDISKKKSIKYLDINSNLSKNHLLLDKYSLDGIHINDGGYQEWVKKINNL